MKETNKQSDIEEIIRRLRGDKGVPSETPLARMECLPPKKESSPPDYQKVKVQEEEVSPRREEPKTGKETFKRIEALEEALSAYRQKESSWIVEKESLRRELRASSQGGQETFSTHFKLLEEKLCYLAGEKESVTQEIQQVKGLLQETKSSLTRTEALLQEKEAALSEERARTAAQESTLLTLEKEKAHLLQKEESLLTQVTLLSNALSEEKQHKEIIALSVKTNQDHVAELRAELERLHELLRERDSKNISFQGEKEKAEARVKEVEEHLVLKLFLINELEEELGTARALVEELRTKTSSQEALLSDLSEKSTSQEALIHSLQEELTDCRGRIGKANEHIVGLRLRLETLNRMRETMMKASTYVQALSSLFGPTPQALPSLRNLVESFMTKNSPEEQFEHHELF